MVSRISIHSIELIVSVNDIVSTLNLSKIDLSKSKKFRNNRNSHNVSIGQFGKIIKLLKENKCKKNIVNQVSYSCKKTIKI